MRRLVITVFLVLVVCLEAGWAASDIPSSHYQSALAMIHFPWQQLGYQIVLLPPRRGFRALTIERQRRIEVYVRAQDDVRMIAYDIAHELGHAMDLQYNTDETRHQWMQLRGIDPSTPWFGCNQCSDYNTPAGDFAEVFAAYLQGAKYFRGRIAPLPSDEQLRALEPFFSIRK